MSDQSLNEKLLDEKLIYLESARAWSPRVISRLETLIRTADDYDLFRINPIRYAADRSMSEQEAIDLFLYATKGGLFEMDWHLICPSCGTVVESFSQLAHVHSHLACDMCGVQVQLSLDDYIQVTFTILPAIREIAYHNPDKLSIEDYYFKYTRAKGVIPPPWSPTDTPYNDLVLEYVEPGGKRVYSFEVNAGIFIIREKDKSKPITFMVQKHPSQEVQQVQLQVKQDGFQVLTHEMPTTELDVGGFTHRMPTGALQQGRVVLEVENQAGMRCPLWGANFAPDFNRSGLQFEPFLSGIRLLTTQTFRDLFRTEVVRSEEGISIQDITFLFTDLKGSTAMYDLIGDPKAYFLVRQHFDALSNVVTRNNGAIVKTIGDAIMATFMNPADAVHAGIDMIEELDEFNRGISQALHLKIGIHRGHSIAVTLNDRLDYFGQTVNIAARVQGLADADEIYITQEAFEYPGVAELLAQHHVAQTEVDVKGVSGKLSVHKIAAHHLA